MDPHSASWTSLASHAIGDYFDLAKPLIDRESKLLDPFVRFVAAQLFIDCHLSSESVLLLVGEKKEWDADLITRSVLEGSLKFMYMLDGSLDEIRSKADEYWTVLPRFYSIKHSERAKQFLEEAPNPESIEWQSFRDLVISDSEITDIRGTYSKQERNALAEKWSFFGMCKCFAKSENEGLRLLVHLAHGYGMSSHLLHKDAVGVGMVNERYGRVLERQAAVKLAHSARIVSDICAFAKMRLFALLRVCGQPLNLLQEVEDRYSVSLFSELTEAQHMFAEGEYGALI